MLNLIEYQLTNSCFTLCHRSHVNSYLETNLLKNGQDFLDIQYDPESTADTSIRCIKCSFRVFNFFVIETLALRVYTFS